MILASEKIRPNTKNYQVKITTKLKNADHSQYFPVSLLPASG